jgi:probable HAF family extracellular repeat protein
MKTIFTSIMATIIASGLFATLAFAQTPSYTVTDLGTMGGTFGSAYGINYEGRVAGAGTLANGNTHAFLTGFPGAMYDLGTLGGPNSNEGGLNASYQMAIFAETSQKDPLSENFCGFGTPYICLAAVWNGTMTPLPTLGGNNGLAFGINNQGQVAGVAETSAKDPSCVAPQVLDFEAVLWGPNPGQVQALPPLPGDTVGFALWLNNNGQVVGSSGTCANTVLVPLAIGPHAVLWENGSPIALGSLGGTMIAAAAGINDLGEVDGGTDLASEIPGFPGVQVHGFLWTKATGMEDIGTVGTDFSSLPTSINNNGQMVGSSCDNMGNCRAFLWQNKVMTDLNALIPANSPLYLMSAFDLNDAGEIAGMALETSTGDVHAFVATPAESSAASRDFAPVSPVTAKPMALPENVRKLLQQRLSLRLAAGPLAGSR